MGLFGKGIRTMNTDSFTLDISIQIMSQKLKDGDRAAYFPVHYGSPLAPLWQRGGGGDFPEYRAGNVNFLGSLAIDLAIGRSGL
jgi:hypothetical protein